MLKPEAAKKKVKVVYWFSRDQKSKDGEKETEIPITHFSNFSQEFDDGKIEDIAKEKGNIINLINMEKLLQIVHKSF